MDGNIRQFEAEQDMAHDLVLKNGLVVTPQGEIRGGVAVDEGKISLIGPDTLLGRGHREIDVEGQIIFPGMFDPHCHLGSGDERNWEGMDRSFAVDTRDFAIGGVTSFATTNMLSPDPLPYCLERSIQSGTGRSWVDFKVTGVLLTYEHVEEIPLVAPHGMISFKFYCGYCGHQAERMGMRKEGITPDLFYLACEQIARIGQPSHLMVHAEEPTVRRMLGERLKASGRADLVAWAEHSPEWSESIQVYEFGVIAHHFGIPMYVVHISRGHTVDLLAHLQAQGWPLVGETCSVFLASNAHEMESRGIGFRAKIQPPIRFASDSERLWRGLREGHITCIGTDTIPYTSKYKAGQPFWESRPGLNIQTIDTLPLLYTEGVLKGKIDLLTLARALSEAPARRWGLFPQKGGIVPGADADLVVVNTDKEYSLGLHRMRGGSDYSIWEGRKVRGMPVMTFLRGDLIAQDGEIVGEAPGGVYLKGDVPPGA